MILVNYQNKINSDTKIDVVQLKNGQAIDKRCYEELQQMMDDCRDEGLDPIICSSYRSHRKQKILYEQKIYDLLNEGYSQTKAKNEAATPYGKNVLVFQRQVQCDPRAYRHSPVRAAWLVDSHRHA